MEVGELERLLRERVQRGRGDLATEGTDIRIAHVVDNDQQYVGPVGIRRMPRR